MKVHALGCILDGPIWFFLIFKRVTLNGYNRNAPFTQFWFSSARASSAMGERSMTRTRALTNCTILSNLRVHELELKLDLEFSLAWQNMPLTRWNSSIFNHFFSCFTKEEWQKLDSLVGGHSPIATTPICSFIKMSYTIQCIILR